MRLEAARGDAATAEGYFNEAVASYHRALAIAPDYLDARLNLATTYIDMHRYGDAVRELRIVEAAKPDAWAVQYRLASALIQEGVRLLNVSSAADPGARERAGTVFIEAVDRLRRAASMSPNNREVHYQLDLANTMLARCRQAALVVRTLAPWYDVDDAPSLARLRARVLTCPDELPCLYRLLGPDNPGNIGDIDPVLASEHALSHSDLS